MPRTAARQPFTILFTCVGRRVELLQAFRSAARRLRLPLRIVALDQSPTAPGLLCADERVLTPPVGEPGYLRAVHAAVRRFRARALIPTIDTDLQAISEQRDVLAAAGCAALIAEPGRIAICRDKIKTYQFLIDSQIDTPATWQPADLINPSARRYPLFIKPRYGSASTWVHKLEDPTDYEYYVHKVRDPIIQEFVDGTEYTLDVYVGLTGQPRCVVPRARWQVRTGEVSKGVVVKDRAIMAAGRRVVEALGDSVRGLVTIQCIVAADRRIRFIEINPRFGGGAPMSIAAGADFPLWLLQELRGQKPRVAFDGFRHGTCMLRYDWSAFVPLPSSLTPRIAKPLRPFPPFA